MGMVLNVFRRPPRRRAPTEAWEEVRGTRCVFVGDTAGKTQLFRHVLGLPFQHTNLEDLGAFDYKAVGCGDGDQLLLLLFDAGTAYDQGPLDRTAYVFTLTRGVQVVWVVFDLTRKETLEVLEAHMSALKSNVSQGAVTALVGNKSDLGGQRQVTASQAQDFVARHGLHAYFETSARTGANVPDMFYGLLELHAARALRREPLHQATSLRFQRQPSISSNISIRPGSSVQETSNDLAPLLGSCSLAESPCLEVGTLVSTVSSLRGRGSDFRDGVRPLGSSPPSLQHRDSSVLSDLPCYPMSARPRGVCLILNNVHFRVAAPAGAQPPDARSGSEVGKTPCGGRVESEAGETPLDAEPEWLADRAGSDVDARRLESTFSALHFSVRVRNDLSDVDMERALRQLSLEDHGARDCLVVCVLSHGSLGRVYGVNGGAIKVSELTAHFCARPCPSLAGKPKLFFLQTCQGRQHLRGLKVKDEHETDAPSSPGSDGIIPDEADFLLGYATVPGYAALRNTSQGSWYVTALCEALEEHGGDLDILNILVKVNRRVSHKVALIDGELVKQVPAPLFTLTRRLLLTK